MAAIKFGTDGVRGRAFDELSRRDAFLIGRAAAEVMDAEIAVLGRDTRESGDALTSAVAAGLSAGGVTPLDLGVAPTPGVAFVAGRRGAIGVMVSASHNPWFDNGIKLFSTHGSKLSDAEQTAVEGRLAELATSAEFAEVPRDLDDDATKVAPIQTELGDWVRAVRASIEGDLSGLRVVVDCANGAASHVVAPALVDLGADVSVLFNQPNGRNINEACGSTHPQALAAEVVAQGADLGLALDGDADRLLAVDALGQVVDGDHLMAMLAIDMCDRGVLANAMLVVTVMSNIGLLKAMEAADVTVEVTPVGDRHVLMALDEHGANFGGEQSGHLIFADHGGTGDGFLSAVQVLSLIKRSGKSLMALAEAAMTSFPQVLRNVAVSKKMPDIADVIREHIAAAEAELGADGRVLVRASGTEPVIRVMVEAADEATANRLCDTLCAVVEQL